MEESIPYDKLVLSHKQEKEILKVLEATEQYKIYNPVLIAQRDKVRRIKDRIIYIEESGATSNIHRCTMSFCIVDGDKRVRNPSCEKVTNYNTKQWVLYGNCCKSCNFIINNRTEEAEKRRLSRAERNIALTGYEL